MKKNTPSVEMSTTQKQSEEVFVNVTSWQSLVRPATIRQAIGSSPELVCLRLGILMVIFLLFVPQVNVKL